MGISTPTPDNNSTKENRKLDLPKINYVQNQILIDKWLKDIYSFAAKHWKLEKWTPKYDLVKKELDLLEEKYWNIKELVKKFKDLRWDLENNRDINLRWVEDDVFALKEEISKNEVLKRISLIKWLQEYKNKVKDLSKLEKTINEFNISFKNIEISAWRKLIINEAEEEINLIKTRLDEIEKNFKTLFGIPSYVDEDLFSYKNRYDFAKNKILKLFSKEELDNIEEGFIDSLEF